MTNCSIEVAKNDKLVKKSHKVVDKSEKKIKLL